MTILHKRNPSWARELIQDGEKYGVPEGTMRHVKKPKTFSSYMALMCELLENEPTYLELLPIARNQGGAYLPPPGTPLGKRLTHIAQIEH
jgi:hypothetical protein